MYENMPSMHGKDIHRTDIQVSLNYYVAILFLFLNLIRLGCAKVFDIFTCIS